MHPFELYLEYLLSTVPKYFNNLSKFYEFKGIRNDSGNFSLCLMCT